LNSEALTRGDQKIEGLGPSAVSAREAVMVRAADGGKARVTGRGWRFGILQRREIASP
jgi:hypothetical protein